MMGGVLGGFGTASLMRDNYFVYISHIPPVYRLVRIDR